MRYSQGTRYQIAPTNQGFPLQLPSIMSDALDLRCEGTRYSQDLIEVLLSARAPSQ